ncbi:hypothetical protein RND81_09G147200 [Saponaria officinalis]|uniref:Dehydrin n=1 Tax=Saponaria officinalis TaxID=3572 RepID=A0AAW1IMQ5_SAPOF
MSNSKSASSQSDNIEAPAQDRGLFDCFGKKEEKEDVPMAEAEHKPSLMEKLHRSNSSSSSSSEEEVEEDGMKIRRRKKKGLTDKIKAKLPGHKNEGAPEEIQAVEKKGILEKIKDKIPNHHKDDTTIAPALVPTPPHCQPQEYSGEIPGEHHKNESVFAPHPAPGHVVTPTPPHCQPGGQSGVGHEASDQEKKGIIGKIMDMFPGGHKDGDEPKKDH